MAVSVTMTGLVKTFGATRAVDAIDLVIEPGELFFLLGPSGCGKTTLLRCIAGFYIPEAGTLRIGDRDVTRLQPHERDTGMVFQSYALWPHMSVTGNVAFGLEQRGVKREEISRRVAEALAMVKMTERADYKPNQLSGGQQQRVALARALVIRPQCLLLDEPLSNLDAKLRLEMRTEIRRICKQAGLTAIYVTHDQKEALSVADRLAVLDGGKIQQLGRPREVYLRPASRFVANFIGETNLLDGTVREVNGTTVRVETGLGTVLAASSPAGQPAVGESVSISLRPESIRLGEAPADCPNTFPASVHDSIYLGEVAQHQVRVGSGTTGGAVIELKAFELNPRFMAVDDEVQQATCWFDAADAVVLTR